jgi:hypothetical protein
MKPFLPEYAYIYGIVVHYMFSVEIVFFCELLKWFCYLVVCALPSSYTICSHLYLGFFLTLLFVLTRTWLATPATNPARRRRSDFHVDAGARPAPIACCSGCSGGGSVNLSVVVSEHAPLLDDSFVPSLDHPPFVVVRTRTTRHVWPC